MKYLTNHMHMCSYLQIQRRLMGMYATCQGHAYVLEKSRIYSLLVQVENGLNVANHNNQEANLRVENMK